MRMMSVSVWVSVRVVVVGSMLTYGAYVQTWSELMDFESSMVVTLRGMLLGEDTSMCL